MIKKTNSKVTHRYNLREVKMMIAASACVLILGFWTVLARQSVKEASQTSQVVTPEIQPTQSILLNLPPMPTLIPPLNTPSTVAVPIINNPPPENVQIVSNPPAAKILLGGARPQPKSAAPAPVTKTRSSK
jgi:hypothetical protein